MKAARILITSELFRQWLPLPVTAVIHGSLQSDEWGMVEILVEHDDLPEVREGERPKIVTPTFQNNVPVEFVEWGLPK